jgi:membrane-bound lytic murein transglycosylase A
MSAAVRGSVAALAALCVAACASPPGAPRPHRAPPAPPRHQPPPPELQPKPSPQLPPERPLRLALAELPGWDSEDHAAAFAAFRATCGLARAPPSVTVCAHAKALGVLEASEARGFLERAFVAEAMSGSGVLTAYFSPIYAARRAPDAEFSAPLRGKPSDLVTVDGGLFDAGQAGRPGAARRRENGDLEPYPDRAAIEAEPELSPLAWMRPEELFFLQIQGSGRLVFEDGDVRKAAYAANNGRPFVGVANPMRERGLLGRDETSGEAIRSWLAAHRGPEADAIMRLNPRFAFFSLGVDDGKPPVGAAGLPLPGGRAIAADPTFHAMGALLWIVGEAPMLAGAFPSYRRMVTALDVGGAIKGPVRGDLYVGEGAAAGIEAGRVRHTLRLYRLVPR